jgi:phage shock protein PspC (stress-responsive transcriptional regulator)
MIGGVCAGLGRRWGIDPLLLRLGFVVVTIAGGLGLPLYLILWAVLPQESGEPSLTTRLRGRPGSWQVAAGTGCLLLAVMLTGRELGIWWSDQIVWPLVLAVSGGALLWRQSTAPPTTPVAARTPRARPSQGEPASAGQSLAGRLGGARHAYAGHFGVLLVIGAALLFLQFNGALIGARDVVLAFVVVTAAAALILAPFWLRLVRGLDAERAERIRSQERAEVAAHLHDSVLQTLALVQKQAGDPKAVSALARRQERDLRTWLSGAPEARPDERLADALRAIAQDVEDQFGAPVEVITVGDRALEDDAGRALVAATREALVNAARHAGDAGPVSLYAETADGRTEVFVRDRGSGFDLAAVPADRRGVRESIIGRMTRHGGRAAVHCAPGGGTEVELILETRP